MAVASAMEIQDHAQVGRLPKAIPCAVGEARWWSHLPSMYMPGFHAEHLKEKSRGKELAGYGREEDSEEEELALASDATGFLASSV